MDKPTIYPVSDRKAHMANKRVRIVKDEHARRPHEDQEMLFHISGGGYGYDPSGSSLGDISLMNGLTDESKACFSTTFNGFKVWTTDRRIDRLCGKDAKYHSPEWLQTQVKAEVDEVQAYCDGEACGLIYEEWCDDEREWDTIDSLYGFYTEDAAVEAALAGELGELDPGVVFCR